MTSSTIIQQGATFDWLQIYFQGDLRTYTPRGQVRKDYAYKDGELLTEFSFLPLDFGTFTFGTITGEYTLVRPVLTAEQTLNLPNHKLRTSSDQLLKPGKNCWLYDVKLISGEGKVQKSTVRFLEIYPDVTRL